MSAVTARAARRAVDTLARVGPEALAPLIEELILRLDALEDTDEDVCAEDWPVIAWAKLGLTGAGDEDDAEDSEDREPGEDDEAELGA